MTYGVNCDTATLAHGTKYDDCRVAQTRRSPSFAWDASIAADAQFALGSDEFRLRTGLEPALLPDGVEAGGKRRGDAF